MFGPVRLSVTWYKRPSREGFGMEQYQSFRLPVYHKILKPFKNSYMVYWKTTRILLYTPGSASSKWFVSTLVIFDFVVPLGVPTETWGAQGLFLPTCPLLAPGQRIATTGQVAPGHSEWICVDVLGRANITPLKTNMTLETFPCSTRSTSSNGFSSVIFIFEGV